MIFFHFHFQAVLILMTFFHFHFQAILILMIFFRGTLFNSSLGLFFRFKTKFINNVACFCPFCKIYQHFMNPRSRQSYSVYSPWHMDSIHDLKKTIHFFFHSFYNLVSLWGRNSYCLSLKEIVWQNLSLTKFITSWYHG